MPWPWLSNASLTRARPTLGNMHRGVLHIGVLVLALTLGLQGQSSQGSQQEIDLQKIGYPAVCDYMFQDKDAYEKRHVEFLDSDHLLVSFPVRTLPCDKNNQPPAEKFRSVIIDTAGTPLHSFDWSRGENIQAGPDGRILMTSGWEIRILDSAFSVLQRLEWVSGRDRKRVPGWRGSIIVAPSRRGFVIEDGYPQNRTAYFEGNPARQIAAVDSCWPAAVTDGGFACVEADKQRLDIHLSDGERNIHDDLLGKAGTPILPDPQTVLLLADKYRLYLLDAAAQAKKFADLHWLAPGWNSGFRWDLASGTERRIMFLSHGCRFPITDTSGFGYSRSCGCRLQECYFSKAVSNRFRCSDLARRAPTGRSDEDTTDADPATVIFKAPVGAGSVTLPPTPAASP
jgi:hypothetical protein